MYEANSLSLEANYFSSEVNNIPPEAVTFKNFNNKKYLQKNILLFNRKAFC